MSKFPGSRRVKRLLLAAAVLLVGAPVFALLHNVFYGLADLTGGVALVSDVLVFLSAAAFVLAVLVCPAGAAYCLMAALLDALVPAWRPAARRVVVFGLPVVAGVAVVASLAVLFNRSTIEEDAEAGFNGSFEAVASGLPVNWYLYDSPLDAGDAEIMFDTRDAIDGAQSLELVVHRVEARGGWRNPGLFQHVDAVAGQSYRVSFWLKNRGCSVRMRLDSTRGDFRQPHEALVEVLDADRTGRDRWQRYEYVYTVPADYRDIRFELNVLAPGTLWLDDVRIEPL